METRQIQGLSIQIYRKTLVYWRYPRLTIIHHWLRLWETQVPSFNEKCEIRHATIQYFSRGNGRIGEVDLVTDSQRKELHSYASKLAETRGYLKCNSQKNLQHLLKRIWSPVGILALPFRPRIVWGAHKHSCAEDVCMHCSFVHSVYLPCRLSHRRGRQMVFRYTKS